MKRLAAFILRHKFASALVTLLILAIAFQLIRMTVSAPMSSQVRLNACVGDGGAACLRFPQVSGTSLGGTNVTFPADFAGDLNLVVMSFEEDQTQRAAAWLPVAETLAQDAPRFAYYNLPVMSAVTPLLRGVITGGMTLIITDPFLREITVMLFLEEKDVFLDALDIGSVETARLFLLNGSGEIVWQADGEYTDEGADALREAVQAFLN